MDREHDRLFFSTRGSQFDTGVLAGIRYGIMISQWNNELTMAQVELSGRIDEALKNKDGELLSLSAEEAQLAAEAIERNVKFEIHNQGVIFNSNTRMASDALPVIKEVAQTAA
ncbi:MAG TPA: hypothetical protein VNG32_00600 [Candidatus Dormibacteraeota bacterium]|nr:hypothetical protein [Candidatus Dormibacteraeota bacterium]